MLHVYAAPRGRVAAFYDFAAMSPAFMVATLTPPRAAFCRALQAQRYSDAATREYALRYALCPAFFPGAMLCHAL